VAALSSGGVLAEIPPKSGAAPGGRRGRDLGLRVLGVAGVAFVLLMILGNAVRIARLLFPPAG
jgi:hypothetical protein